MTEFVSCPAIALICYFIGFCFNRFFPKQDRFIPCLCGVCGIILGVVVYYTIPGFICASNWISAVCVGLVSGLAATGADQVYKQFTK